MFDELVESTSKKKTNKIWGFWLSATVQALILIILILIPLIYTRALPPLLSTSFLAAPPPPPPPPPPAAVVKVIKQPKFVEQKMVAPTVIPKKIEIIKEQAPPPDVGVTGGVPGGVPGGSSAGVLGGIIGGAPGGLPAPPPKPSIIRVGGNVMAGKLIRQITPQYPQIAKIAHVSGSVVLHAIIGEDGTIQQLQVISGPSLLRQAAEDAVRQWRYVPYKLNGQPVKVDTTVTVIFNLGD